MTTCGIEIRYLILLLGMILGTAGPAHAVDGVLEINQACAVNTGCFTGDSAGFPVTPASAGSYRLTGNLTVPDENTTAIQIDADNVTVDLNGFAIIGPTQCTGTPVSCSPTGTGDGVTAFVVGSNSPVAVLNGTVRGMGDKGVALDRGRVDGVSAFSNGGDGISVTRGLVRNSVSGMNGGDGIHTASGSTVSDNTCFENGGRGIAVGEASTVTGNTARDNGQNGISCTGNTVSGCSVSYNTASGNAGFGFSGGSMLIGNAATTNTDSGFFVSSGTTLIENTARNNGGFGFEIIGGDPSGYGNNVITNNTAGTISGAAGIEIGTNICDTNTTCP